MPGGEGETAPWWRGAVIYQIYPRSFQDSDGDGVGDLRGLLARLDYIASLGVDAVWVSPVFRSPMADFGYDVADYGAVDPLFGDMAGFDAVLAKAHALGLKLIVDLVLSHTSDAHPWFKESRQDRTNGRADWYVWADPKPDGTAPNNWLSVFGGPAWSFEARRRQYYLHNFLAVQPDLNLHHPPVQEALLDVVRFWLERGVDGVRLDVANFYTHDPQLRDNPPWPPEQPRTAEGRPDNPYYWQRHLYDKTRPETLPFLARLRQLLDGYPGDRFAMAEIVDDEPAACAAAYTAPGLLHSAYHFGLFTSEVDAPRIERILSEALAASAPEGWPPRSWPSFAFSNHDVPRVASRWARALPQLQAADRAVFFLALLIALPGTVCLYQGEELGLTEAVIPFERLRDPYGRRFWPDFPGRDGCRTPMPWTEAPGAGFTTGEPWLPIPEEHRANCVARQEADPASPLAMARRLLALRRACAALRLGPLAFEAAPPGCLVFRRGEAGGSVFCAFNFGRDAVILDPGEARTAEGRGATLDRGRLTLAGGGWALLVRQE
jgi:alpha-glucosidase